MPLLSDIRSELVQPGWWRDFNAPFYRQHLWTATNIEALTYLGLLGLLGAIAGDRIWIIARHFLLPAIQLPDPEAKRRKLRRSDAIKAIWIRIKYIKESFSTVWNE